MLRCGGEVPSSGKSSRTAPSVLLEHPKRPRVLRDWEAWRQGVRVAVPVNKVELLHALVDGYEKLSHDLDRVPADRAREQSMPGHAINTVMSPADLVAYLIGWNELVLLWHAQRSAGVEPAFPAEGFTWNQLGDLAAKFYADQARSSWPELRSRLEMAKSNIVRLVQGLSNEELYGAPWYGKYTAGRMIQFNTSSPYANARRRLRTWLRDRDL